MDVVKLKYKDKVFVTPEGGWGEFSWNEGNMSCDCNRSRHIQLYCDKDFPLLDCGEEIELCEESKVFLETMRIK